MSVTSTICPHCGAENLPDRAVCEACGADLRSLRSGILFALLALGVGFVVGVLTFMCTVFFIGMLLGEFYATLGFCAPVMAFTFGLVAIILTYSWRDRIRRK